LYFQAFDDKKNCYGYYYDGTLGYESLPQEFARTWSHPLSVGDRKIECADLYCGKQIDQVCPEDLRDDWSFATGRLKAFLRSFILSKVDLNENCFYDLVPERFLLDFYAVKNEITKRVFEEWERPQNYDFLHDLNLVVKEIKYQRLNLDLVSLRRSAYDVKTKNFLKRVSRGKIYCDYNIFGTKTGRLATNADTFPILNMHKDLRKYVRPTNSCFVELDYNAFELRVLLYLSDADQPDQDIHQWNVQNVYQGAISREEAKKRIFSWLYNIDSKDHLSEGVYNRDKILNKYWDGARVVNPFDRSIESDKFHATSYLVQSTAADIVLRQMTKVHKMLKNKKSHIAFTVHDSVVIDMAEEDMELLPEIKKQFSTFRDTQFLTSVSIGSNFGNMESEE
tara:strand:- start:2331 stop:3512 length:1182 start_codon:yes stop_codon:yes gene_type:complete